nr:hypothetical protein [Streptococcus equi]
MAIFGTDFSLFQTDDQVFDFVKRQRVDCVVVGQSTTKDPGNAKLSQQ